VLVGQDGPLAVDCVMVFKALGAPHTVSA
jgi:hypothetical protein